MDVYPQLPQVGDPRWQNEGETFVEQLLLCICEIKKGSGKVNNDGVRSDVFRIALHQVLKFN